ncbi:MAG: hypothetical protein OWV35_09175, partial [Firmicutes bacterium]|nr:hypothetical protein [Bacillota bacterium]
VRWHLLMSNTAFRRDVADSQTVDDFVRQVQSMFRLRLLLVQHVEHENESLYPEAERNVSPGERGLIRNLVQGRRQQEDAGTGA